MHQGPSAGGPETGEGEDWPLHKMRGGRSWWGGRGGRGPMGRGGNGWRGRGGFRGGFGGGNQIFQEDADGEHEEEREPWHGPHHDGHGPRHNEHGPPHNDGHGPRHNEHGPPHNDGHRPRHNEHGPPHHYPMRGGPGHGGGLGRGGWGGPGGGGKFMKNLLSWYGESATKIYKEGLNDGKMGGVSRPTANSEHDDDTQLPDAQFLANPSKEV